MTILNAEKNIYEDVLHISKLVSFVTGI